MDSLVWRRARAVARLKVPTGPRSLCLRLRLLSVPLRPIRRQVIVKAPEPHCLLISTHELGRGRTILLHLAMHIPISYCPRKSPEQCVKGKDLPSQGLELKAWHLCLVKHIQFVHTSVAPSHRLCLLVLTDPMFYSNELQGRLCQCWPSGGHCTKLASDLDFWRGVFNCL